MQCFKNAQKINEITLLDRAFHYGDGCFSTAKLVNGDLQLLSRHLERLKWSCEQLSFSLDLRLLEQTLVSLRQEYAELNGTLKMVVSRGEGARGYSLPQTSADFWVFYYPHSVDVFVPRIIQTTCLQHTIGLSMPALVGIKSLNRLEQVILKKELDERGFSEGLVSDIQGHIVEGVSSNCFMLLNGQWITPELRYNGVHGIMRAEILARMQKMHIDCHIRCVTLDELPHIQALFFCNALNPMLIASQINDQYCDTQAALDLFHHLQLDQIC